MQLGFEALLDGFGLLGFAQNFANRAAGCIPPPRTSPPSSPGGTTPAGGWAIRSSAFGIT